MKKLIVFYFLLAVPAARVFAQETEKKVRIDVTDGYQRENFHWSIAGNSNGQNPDVFSELKWMKLGGQSLAANLQWNVYQKFVFYADYNRLFITSGTVNDSDYSGDHRSDRTYNETFDAGKGHTVGWAAGAGYQLVNHRLLKLVTFAGYNQNRQVLFLYGDANRFPDLNSSYSTAWKGVFIKATAAIKLTDKLKFNADVTYSQVNYNATGNWNLITTFKHPVSYHHHANGYGINGGGTLSFDITKNIAVQAGAGYLHWQTGNGIDQLYLSSGEIDKTQMNGAYRNGFRVFAGLIISID